ncbi:hypothetical protein ID866_6239 [Astraeus odoratus]|nr:hypothetical protein ID866_6239 [Astraeus odoratus]
MGTIPLYKDRKWQGWYNSPGSYEIAKRYGGLAKSSIFDGLFPGGRTEPATLFGMDGRKGPRFGAAHSGTVIEETGHLAALFMKKCVELASVEIIGRETQKVGITIAELNHLPPFEVPLKRERSYSPIFASVPIVVSICTCLTCALVRDWYCFSMILLGILVSGASCLVIGSGELLFTHPQPAQGSPPGDGILTSEKEIVFLKGDESAVNSITRGRFALRFSSNPNYHDIGWCSVLLMIQFLAQLIFIPQGTLFGQFMFVTSLAVSWGYNIWLSSLDKESIQKDILMEDILKEPKLTRYVLCTRTSMAVFVLLVARPEKPERFMEDLLPNDTRVWAKWKANVIERLREGEKLEFHSEDWNDMTLSDEERCLLETLYKDAQSAYDGFAEYGCLL